MGPVMWWTEEIVTYRHIGNAGDVLFGVLIVHPDLPVAKAVAGHHVWIAVGPRKHKNIRERVRGQVIADVFDGLPAASVTALIIVIVYESDRDDARLQTPALSKRHRSVENTKLAPEKFFREFSAVFKL